MTQIQGRSRLRVYKICWWVPLLVIGSLSLSKIRCIENSTTAFSFSSRTQVSSSCGFKYFLPIFLYFKITREQNYFIIHSLLFAHNQQPPKYFAHILWPRVLFSAHIKCLMKPSLLHYLFAFNKLSLKTSVRVRIRTRVASHTYPDPRRHGFETRFF